MNKNALLPATKGWVSLYALVLLNLVIALLMLQTAKLNSYVRRLKVKSELEEVEIFTIRKIKSDYYNYEESDCTLSYKQMSIDIDYEGMEANATITTPDSTIKFRVTYDDIDENITDFAYLE